MLKSWYTAFLIAYAVKSVDRNSQFNVTSSATTDTIDHGRKSTYQYLLKITSLKIIHNSTASDKSRPTGKARNGTSGNSFLCVFILLSMFLRLNFHIHMKQRQISAILTQVYQNLMLRPCPYSYCTLYALFNNCCPQRLGSIYLLSLVRLLWIWLDPGHLTSLQLIGPSWVLAFLNFCGQKRRPESLLAAVPRLSPPLTLFAFDCEIDHCVHSEQA